MKTAGLIYAGLGQESDLHQVRRDSWKALTGVMVMGVVVPSPAATMILVRQQTSGWEVLLTQRPPEFRVLGGYFVFPGGKAEEQDREVTPQVLGMAGEGEMVVDALFYAAAVRELFEEVGVFLGNDGEGGSPTPERRKTSRESLLRGERTFLGLLQENRWQLEGKRLQYFGHRLTPEGYPHRFDTHFFVALWPDNQSLEPNPEEVAETVWLPPQEALQRHEDGKLPLPLPTQLSLEALTRSNRREEWRLT